LCPTLTLYYYYYYYYDYRSGYMMALGTILVLIFSDPMVEVLGSMGKRTGVPAFYIR